MSGARSRASTPADRAAAAAEVRQLRDALVGDFNTTFRGTYLFSGTRVDVQPYVGTARRLDLPGRCRDGAGRGRQGPARDRRVRRPRGRAGHRPGDVFTAMETLAVAIEAGDNAAIGTGIDALERAFERVAPAPGPPRRRRARRRRRLRPAARSCAWRPTPARQARGREHGRGHLRMNEAETAYRAALGAVGTAERLSLLDYLR